MDWKHVKDIMSSLDKLPEIADEAKVKLMLNDQEVFFHSVGTDRNGKTIFIHLNMDEDKEKQELRKENEQLRLQINDLETQLKWAGREK